MARLLSLVVLAALLTSLACGDDDDDDDDTDGGEAVPGDVTATLTEFAIEIAPATAPAGEVTFEVANDGTTEHEFEIFRTDLAPDALPTTDDGSVDSEGEGVEEIDEIEEFEPGNTETLTTELEAGNYVMICNVVVGDTSHYQEGMRAGFVVD
jgi:uncharacterized cupredoxin-like copper-binding protein